MKYFKTYLFSVLVLPPGPHCPTFFVSSYAFLPDLQGDILLNHSKNRAFKIVSSSPSSMDVVDDCENGWLSPSSRRIGRHDLIDFEKSCDNRVIRSVELKL